jgi:hypothetical protein
MTKNMTSGHFNFEPREGSTEKVNKNVFSAEKIMTSKRF